MEYVPGGELSTYLQSNGRIPEDMVKTITRQVVHALRYLHKRRITHRDIKPDNILIASLDPLKVKLSDFGLSKAVQEETFLKTFCGTLLYCAPEVYPDYQTYRGGELRKRRRAGDPPLKSPPYGQSVDMWSLGAVLFHILCGEPPYMGRGDDRGSHMLRNIMMTDPNFDLMRTTGVSEDGIDFVCRLLNRDPSCRPTEEECLRHPWIAAVTDVEEYEPDGFFGLSDIGEEGDDDYDDHAEDELDASQLSLYDDAEAEDEQQWVNEQVKRRRFDNHHSGMIAYPSFPNLVPPDPNGGRLYGEIASSAQHSSGVFPSGMDPFKARESNMQGFMSSTGESITKDNDNSVCSVVSLPEKMVYDSAPSLIGAENLVGELRMNSTSKGVAEKGPTESPGHAKGIRESVDSSGDHQGHLDSEDAPKPDRISRRRSLPLPERNLSFPSAKREKVSESQAGARFDDELAVTIDAQTGAEITAATTGDNGPGKGNSDDAHPKESAVSHIPPMPDSVVSVQPPLVSEQPTRPLLGQLTTVPGSIFDVTIRLQERMTSWGRGLQASIRYPQPLDTRIPAYALEITFWAPAMEERIAAGEHWMDVPGVMTILSTKTKQSIWVNDVELRRGPVGQDGFYFGKLYNNDIITVYRQKDEYLKLRCEFYYGTSAGERPREEKDFVVKKVLQKKKK